jgi:hypothetical protein
MPSPATLVHQTALSTGTGNFALTKVNGKNDFATAFTTGGTNVFDYFISNRSAAEWERGTGHMATTSDLVRDTVIETNAGTTVAIDFTAGTKDVTNDVPALTQVRGTTAASSGAIAVFDTTAGNLLKHASVTLSTATMAPTTSAGVTLGTTALRFSAVHVSSGVGFPATQNDSADANTLDDYEEGTFTPALTFGGGSTGLTFSEQTGNYTKVGNRVTGRLRLILTSNGTSTGAAVVTGLPFTVGSTHTANINVDNYSSGAGVVPMATPASGGTTILLRLFTQSTGVQGSATNETVTDTAVIILLFAYEVA